MKASLKYFAGAAVAVMALATVACGKSGGNSNNNNAFNCVQVGATCVATAPGYVSSGTWRGQSYSPNTGAVEITVRLSVNGGQGGYGGGYGQIGYGQVGQPGYGQIPVQTIATVSIRTQTAVISGTGIANGSASAFTTSINTQYGVINIAGNFSDSTQVAMNISTSGQIAVNALLTGRPDNSGIGGGYGNPGYGYGGGGFGYGGGVTDPYGYGNPGYGYGYGY